MNILMVAHFTTMPEENGNNRFNYLAKILSEKGHDVTLITTSFSHNDKDQRLSENRTISDHYKIELCYEPGYKKNVSLQRFYSHYIWGKNVKACLDKKIKPDVVYCAVPSLTAPLVAAKYCERNNIKFIIDVQDLWPEAFQMVFNIPVISNVIFAPFKWLANGIYKRADEIIAVSQTYVNMALSVNKKCKTGHSVFLGTELKTFDENSKKNTELKKSEDEIWLAYCGTLGSSYDLSNALLAVNKARIPNLKFIIMGDGPMMKQFKDYATKLGVNAVFTGRLPYDDMCSVLCNCDITINPIMHGAAQSIINKHADYLSSGLPIINTQESREFCDLIRKYNCGINCRNSEVDDIVEALLQLCNDKKLRYEMGLNARRCAEELFDRMRTYNLIVKIIES